MCLVRKNSSTIYTYTQRSKCKFYVNKLYLKKEDPSELLSNKLRNNLKTEENGQGKIHGSKFGNMTEGWLFEKILILGKMEKRRRRSDRGRNGRMTSLNQWT